LSRAVLVQARITPFFSLRRAAERGCRRVFLDTFSFQAPGFYQKLGYQVYGRAEDWPDGHAHLFLRKDLPLPS
jgi:ribosomal protein S18 acetylase RimI-like enzyme